MTKIFTRAASAAIVALLAVPGAALAARPADRNRDRLPDRWERAHHLSLHAKQARRDPDHDGLRNLAEYRAHTDPRRADTDRDGLRDGAELTTGNDPLDADTDGDGVRDGDEHAGTVLSFDGTTLTLRLAAGGKLTGQVDDATEVWCGDEGDNAGDDGGDTGDDGTDPADTADDDAVDGRAAAAGHDAIIDASAARAGLDDAAAPDDSGDDPGDDVADDPGDDPAADDSGDDSDLAGDCSSDDLQAGVTVSEADIRLTSRGTVFEAIELAPTG